MAEMNRRQFMTYLGVGTAAMLGTAAGLDKVALATGTKKWNSNNKPARGIPSQFKPIAPTRVDEVVLAPGFKYDIIASYGDVINSKGEQFGDSVDLSVYFPIDALQGGNNSEEGLLWVNHEFPMSENYMKMLGISGKYGQSLLAQYPELLRMQKQAVGGAVIRVVKENGTWRMMKDDRYNRRIDATTRIQLTGPGRGSSAVKGAAVVEGSLGNCSGGRTLWNTVLSCEENTEYGKYYGWPNFTDEHYGWVMEVDPFNPDAPVRKHTALGRFAHENTAMALTKDGRAAVYMGDDKGDEFFYKFISKKKYDPNSREANFDILEEGTLYVADLFNGKWIALDYDSNEKIRAYKKPGAEEPFFKNQADVLTFVREAGRAVGATPLDRPEDVEIHPHDGSVYLALTNNFKHGNFFGQIVRFVPGGGDHGSDTITFEVFATGGPQSGLSGLVGCETTGPWFTPNEKTLFLNIQHPDTWNPDRLGIGRAATIAISGFKGV